MSLLRRFHSSRELHLEWTGALVTLRALLLVGSVWCTLLSGRCLVSSIGTEGARLVSFAAALALVALCRIERPPTRRADLLASSGALVGGLLGGWIAYPSLAASIGLLGLSLGLPPHEPAVPTAGLVAFVATVLLAPAFEEILYRDRVLLSLAPAIGRAPAIVASSTLFALPHLLPWSVLGTFVVGVLLACIQLRVRRTALCVGLHAGLNISAYWR
jgi:membrane protease YdiL (CAAX protease family)